MKLNFININSMGMKFNLCFSLILFIGAMGFAQEFKQMLLRADGNSTVIKQAVVDYESNQVTYLDENQKQVSLDLSNYDQVYYKKGSQWFAGMAGAMGGTVIGSLIGGGGKNQEWYYGLGPKLLIGGGLGAAVGALFPRYKKLKLGDEAQVEVGLNHIRLKF